MTNTLTCMERALAAVPGGGAQASDVACVGITNQRETTVAWDRDTGKPLHNAVVWLDMRTSQLCADLEAEFKSKDHFRATSGLPISTYFSAMKMRWLLDNAPAVKGAASRTSGVGESAGAGGGEGGQLCFGTVDSWLINRLTGGAAHVTDVTNAARTMLMDLETLTWHAPTLSALGIPADSLPKIVSCAEEFGVISSGPLRGVPITGCLGDQHAATLGQRCSPGEAKNTYGTGCFMLLNTGDRAVQSTHGLLTTMAWKLGPEAPPRYALAGLVFSYSFFFFPPWESPGRKGGGAGRGNLISK